jgi:outer membrane protein assembly factor BamB
MRRRSFFLSILVATAMALSSLTVFGILPASAQVSSGALNWNTNSNYGLNWNYINQSTIGPNNVQGLALKWVFSTPANPGSGSGFFPAEGVCCTPIVEGGVVYLLTNYNTLFALNSNDGSLIWKATIPQSFDSPLWVPGTNNTNAGLGFHYHNMDLFYSTQTLGQPLIWVSTDNYTIFAYNADTGSLVLDFTPSFPVHGQSGNLGWYTPGPHGVVLDDVNHILVVGNSGLEEAFEGRGFLDGYLINSTNPTLIWQTAIIPPQDGSNPNWGVQQVQNMIGAWIFNGTGAVDLKALPASQLNATLYDDWGYARYSNSTNSYSGTTPGWGGPWAFNSTTGIAYIGTEQASPDANATFRPGPDLWSDSVLAVDEHTGQLVWGFQTNSHDVVDYDCSWSVMLVGNDVIKGCKDGLLYAMNQATGALDWFFNPPTSPRDNTSFLNPLNSADMSKPWPCGSSLSACLVNPGVTGGIESDPAYDPGTNMIYVVTYNAPSCYVPDAVPPIPNTFALGLAPAINSTSLSDCGITASGGAVNNLTVYAVNANTGTPVWHYSYPLPFRGGLTVSNGVVYIPTEDGHILMLDAATGNLINNYLVGSAMVQQPAIATTANGNTVLIQPVTSVGGIAGFPPIPGEVLALAPLAPSAAPPCGPGTTNVNGVCQSTGAGGVSATTFYGVVAIAVILAIVAISLGVTRRRRFSPAAPT